MQQNVHKNIPIQNLVNDELILVVKRNDLFEKEAFQGMFEVNFEKYLTIIKNKKEFLPRSLMEYDLNYKQIIPYLIFTFNNKYFLMQRRVEATETRLRNKFSLGIGGHIRQEDMETDSIIDWATREFHEEVDYNGKLDIKPLGLLNDDSNEVGKVHVGFVFLLQGNSDQIKVKSELKNGNLLSLQECEQYFENMESWTQLVFKFLNKN